MIIRFSNHSSVYWAGKNFWSSHHAELQAAFVWALDTVHQGLIIKIIYSYLVTDFGQPQLLFHIDPCLWVRSRDLCLSQHWFANGFNTGHASSFRKSRILWRSRPADWVPPFYYRVLSASLFSASFHTGAGSVRPSCDSAQSMTNLLKWAKRMHS